ncbi:MAG: hypothetical protein ACTS2F_30905 [Thainema sp.]
MMTDCCYQTISICTDGALKQYEGEIALASSVVALQQDSGDDQSAVPFAAGDQPFIDLRDRISPEILRVLAIGSPQVVEDCVMTLFRLGYARPEEWSQPLPTVNPGEVMRILTKRIVSAP